MAKGNGHELRAVMLAGLRLLASVLLRMGIGYREFAELSKLAFVQAATDNYGLRGRPTNISRVAAMTGINRKEVRRIRTRESEGHPLPPITELLNAPGIVLEFWHATPEFCDENGRPLVLPYDDASPSFVELVRRCGGDLPPGAVRAELRRLGAVSEEADGRLAPRRREVVAEQSAVILRDLFPRALSAFAPQAGAGSEPARPVPGGRAT